MERFADPARDTSATHTYDGNGQRTTSVVTSASITTTTTWTYDGLTLLAYATERSDGATSALTYLTSEGGRPVAGVWSSSEASAPVRFSILTNDRGDVVALADAAGEVFATYGYDAFGAPRPDLTASRETSAAPHGPTIAAEQPLRYAGYVFDTHSGLYYCSQRYYDPQTMQFLTKDPARADGEESAYQYCGGDPVGKVDPTGLVALRITAYWRRLDANEPRWLNPGGRYRYWGNYREYLHKAMAKMAAYYYEHRNDSLGRRQYRNLRDHIEMMNSTTGGFWMYFERYGNDDSCNWFRRKVRSRALVRAVELGDWFSGVDMTAGLLGDLASAGARVWYNVPSRWWR